MKFKDKLWNLPIGIVLGGYVVFCSINAIVHVAGFYTYPIFEQMDIAMYLIKIAIVWLFKELLVRKDRRFSFAAKLFTMIIACDAIEVFLCTFSNYPTIKNDAVYIMFVCKCILEFCGIASLIEDGKLNVEVYEDFVKLKQNWFIVHGLVIGSFILEACIKYTFFLYLVYLMLIIRFVFFIVVVNYLRKHVFSYQLPIEYEYNPKIRIIKRVGYGVLFIAFICFLFMNYTYKNGDIQLLDENGNVLSEQTSVEDFRNVGYYLPDSNQYSVYLYSVKNLMPSRSGFSRLKYGLINLKTGVSTGPIYNGPLEFDYSGIAYDYDRHFVDLNGKEVLKVPYIVKARTSTRQKILNDLISEGNLNDSERHRLLIWEYSHEDGQFVTTSKNTYFENGVAVYHSYYNDRYGIISENGDLITMPKFRYFSGQRDFEVSMVSNYNNTELDVVNSKGESLLNESPNEIKFYDEARIFIYGLRSGIERLVKYNGEKFEGNFHQVEKCGDIACFAKYDDDIDYDKYTLEAFYGDAELIFSSDKYSKCFAKADSDGKLNYFILTSREDDNYRQYLADLNGNLIVSEGYKDISRSDEYDTFWAVREDDKLDIIRLDGSVINTEYYYCQLSGDRSQARIKESKESNLYNYIDTNGNLEPAWYEEQ
ncbi:hypothetical protein [Pseudobutyrivibrio sp. MD2005]|uniref:hypothetical protein n=1 Tax=Pseudobutyrivibrio sp. MD2005 TaxID=1410616 RepID=UPI000487468B|nr:hypothetical protein [Pseudobutyrivibrio sp. MD2005]